MKNRLILLALIAATCGASACASPNTTMGPDWARYVGGTYRHRQLLEEAAAATADPADPAGATPTTEAAVDPFAPAAVYAAQAARNPYAEPAAQPTTAPYAVRTAPVAPAVQPVRITHAEVPHAPRSVPIPAQDAPVAIASPTPAPVAAPAPAPVAEPAPAPVVTARETSQPAPAQARRFVRLKIGGMQSVESDPMEVRRQLRAAEGVKEVVLSFKTKTAIVVVEKDTSVESVIAALDAPYSAEVMN